MHNIWPKPNDCMIYTTRALSRQDTKTIIVVYQSACARCEVNFQHPNSKSLCKIIGHLDPVLWPLGISFPGRDRLYGYLENRRNARSKTVPWLRVSNKNSLVYGSHVNRFPCVTIAMRRLSPR